MQLSSQMRLVWRWWWYKSGSLPLPTPHTLHRSLHPTRGRQVPRFLVRREMPHVETEVMHLSSEMRLVIFRHAIGMVVVLTLTRVSVFNKRLWFQQGSLLLGRQVGSSVSGATGNAFCGRCGKPAAGRKFCTGCGAPVS